MMMTASSSAPSIDYNSKDTPYIHNSPYSIWSPPDPIPIPTTSTKSRDTPSKEPERPVIRHIASAPKSPSPSPSAEVGDSLPGSQKRLRSARQLRSLHIDQARDRKQFGLDRLKVKITPTASQIREPRVNIDTPPSPPILLVAVDDSNDTDLETTPTMSNPDQTKPIQSGSSSFQRGPANLPPTSSRMRNPAPPSPLSRIQTTGGQGDQQSRSLPTPSSSTVPVSAGGAHKVPPSPCFIHSHLDRTGTLQDWLQAGTSQPTSRLNGPPSRSSNGLAQSHPPSSSRRPHVPQHQARHLANSQNQPLPDISSAGSSRVTSPIQRVPSMSGYESDKSSILGGSALLDGDFMDDEDDTGSLTRQLAETAQGVREMSKQLGRTRVRSKIQTVLIVTKARDNRLIKLTRELALYLMQKRPLRSPDGQANGSASTQSSFNSKPDDRGMIVYVDAQLRHSNRFDAAGLQRDYPDFFRPVHRRRSSSSASVNNLSSWPSATSMSEAKRSKDEGQLRYWTSEMCSSAPHLFDFVVTLGGDGTVLFTSWLFQKIVPPVLPFALGSLGFLTNFDFSQYKPTMDRVIDDGIRVNLRMRFTCTVYRAIAPEDAVLADKSGKKRKAIKKPGGEILMSTVDKKGWEALEGGASASAQTPMTPSHSKREKEIMCFTTRPVEQFEVLNDLVVDRGPSPFVSLLELFGDEHHLTTVQADGLTVSTPTGSTAYSLSAGGSLVHPQIPALLITPICPHTLSFRPMLLPDSMELRICVPYNSRSTAWASFDGRGRVELKQGDHIKVTASKYPFPTVCADKASTDWFNAISRTLRWNEREKQKSFVVVEEDSEEPVKKQSDRRRAEDNMKDRQSRRQSQSQNAGQAPSACDEGEESDETDSEEEAFDIDDKSGGDNTPSPNTPDASESGPPTYPNPEPHRQRSVSSNKSGVDTPDRFMSSYDPPHAVSQRHLIDKLNAAEVELSKKENEDGQRDHIRADSRSMRVVPGHHMIPSGRGLGDSDSNITAEPESSASEAQDNESQDTMGDLNANKPEKTPKPRPRNRSKTRRPADMERRESKAKAFAFFGQDDSASDQSEEENPQ